MFNVWWKYVFILILWNVLHSQCLHVLPTHFIQKICFTFLAIFRVCQEDITFSIINGISLDRGLLPTNSSKRNLRNSSSIYFHYPSECHLSGLLYAIFSFNNLHYPCSTLISEQGLEKYHGENPFALTSQGTLTIY